MRGGAVISGYQRAIVACQGVPFWPDRERHGVRLERHAMSSLAIHPSKVEPTKLCFRTSMGCTASLMPERFREKLLRQIEDGRRDAWPADRACGGGGQACVSDVRTHE